MRERLFFCTSCPVRSPDHRWSSEVMQFLSPWRRVCHGDQLLSFVSCWSSPSQVSPWCHGNAQSPSTHLRDSLVPFPCQTSRVKACRPAYFFIFQPKPFLCLIGEWLSVLVLLTRTLASSWRDVEATRVRGVFVQNGSRFTSSVHQWTLVHKAEATFGRTYLTAFVSCEGNQLRCLEPFQFTSCFLSFLIQF